MAQIIKRISDKFFAIKCQIELFYLMAWSRHKKKAFVFGSPSHRNMGDHAQTYCIKQWINTNYDGYSVIVFNQNEASGRLIKLLQKKIKLEDLIFFHSGYHLTDLYPVKDTYCQIASLFPTHKIVVFPQTINFIKDKKDEEFVANTFNNHGKITLLCRDEFSYQTAQNIFNKCKLYLFPDIVTSLIGTLNYTNEDRDGVLFCMRNDVESFYSKEKKDAFIDRFKEFKTDVADTSISTHNRIIKNKRGEILKEIWDSYSKYKVIITDRYHGTIFSLITNTPVIVIASTDHKLSSGVKWFPESFCDYVFYAENLDIAYSKALEILNRKEKLEKLPPYFEENYYSKLKSFIDNEAM